MKPIAMPITYLDEVAPDLHIRAQQEAFAAAVLSAGKKTTAAPR